MFTREAPEKYLRHEIDHLGIETYQELHRTSKVFVGALSDNWVYTPSTQSPECYVLRVPKSPIDREWVVQSIQSEYNGIGATDLGISFRLRTIAEQVALIDALALHGLQTINYLEVSEDTILFPFVRGVGLNAFVAQVDTEGKFSVIKNILYHLATAHKNGIIFGDRWCKNTLVLDNGDFAEIDFDIELLGPQDARAAFEMSQTLYHLVHFSQKNRLLVTSQLARFVREHEDIFGTYDSECILHLLTRQTEYFLNRGVPYEGILPTNDEIHEIIGEFVKAKA